MRVLDLSGYGFSGKHALSDLVREFEGYYVPHFAFEFNLLRIQGGILDLESALSTDWSLIRSSEAIRRFRRVAVRLGTPNRWSDPTTWFSAMGPGYDLHFGHRFLELSEWYVDQLVDDRWKTNWPYPRADLSGIGIFTRKALRKLGFKRAEDFEVFLAAPDDFVSVTREYLRRLFSNYASQGADKVVLHNAFEPFNPSRCLKFFDWARCIVVDRDPRDNFAQHWVTGYRPMQVSVESFIQRYRIYHEMAERFDDDDPAILRIHFEDLVLDPAATIKKVLTHLGEGEGIHHRARQCFVPEESMKNVGIWRDHPRPDEIRRIEDELGKYCRSA